MQTRHFPFFPLMLALFLLSACGSSVPQLPRLSADAKVLAFGDSLTHGTGAGKDESYPAVLQQLIGRRTINAGVPGEVSATGLQRLPGLLDEHKPDLLILCHGGNDLLQSLDQTKLLENLRNMINAAEQRGIKTVLIGVPEPGLILGSAKLYVKLAGLLKLPYEGKIISEVLSSRDLKSDPAHPNAAGYRKVAEAVAEVLRQSGAVE